MRKTFKILLVCLCVCLTCSSVACGGNGAASSLVSGGSKTTVSEDVSSKKVSFEGQTVSLATWKDPWRSYDGRYGVKEYLEKEYGINLELQLIGQGDSVQTIQSAIASDTQPELFQIGDQFLSAVSVLQPLETTGLDLNKLDNQAILNATKIDGKPYVTAGADAEYNRLHICVYNKKLFKEAGIPTPTEYFERGEWTFDNFVFCAEKISALGDKYKGVSLHPLAAFALSGDSFYRFENGRVEYSEGENLLSVYSKLQDLCRSGTASINRSSFGDGRDGMAITDTFGLMRIGYFTKINPDHLGAVLLPKMSEEDEHKVTAPIMGYGVVKGCKNIGAAAVALEALSAPFEAPYYSEEYLEKHFWNEEITTFYLEMYEEHCKDIVYYIDCDMSLENTGYVSQNETFYSMWSELNDTDLESAVAKRRESHKKAVDKINGDIEKSLQPPPETDPRVDEFLRQ